MTFKIKFKKVNRRSKIIWKNRRGDRRCRNMIKAVQVCDSNTIEWSMPGDWNDIERNKRDFTAPQK